MSRLKRQSVLPSVFLLRSYCTALHEILKTFSSPPCHSYHRMEDPDIVYQSILFNSDYTELMLYLLQAYFDVSKSMGKGVPFTETFFKRCVGVLCAKPTSQYYAKKRKMRERDAFQNANGHCLSPRGVSSVLVAKATLTPIAPAAAPRRSAPQDLIRLDKFAARFLPRSNRFPALDLGDAGDGGTFIGK